MKKTLLLSIVLFYSIITLFSFNYSPKKMCVKFFLKKDSLLFFEEAVDSIIHYYRYTDANHSSEKQEYDFKMAKNDNNLSTLLFLGEYNTSLLQKCRSYYKYKKSIKDISLIKQITESFLLRLSIPNENFAKNTCKPFFRDILLLYKNNKLVGSALICFSCGQHKLVNYQKPKNDNDYEEVVKFGVLKELLKSK